MKQKKTQRKTTAIAKREVITPVPPTQYPAIQQTATGQLLQMAVDKNLDVEKLEKLIELKHREEELAAKIDFDHHFSEMQKQFPIVYKKKAVKNDKGTILYKYCPLHVVERAFRKIIHDNGFSYRFGSHTGKEGTTQPYCTVSGWGHEVETPLDIPLTKLTSATNKIQEYGAALSYGYRYAFCAAFGIVIAGEDDDAQTPDPQYKEPRRVSGPDFDAVYKDMNDLYGILLSEAKIKKGIATLEQCALIKERVLELKETRDAEALQALYDEWNAAYNERNQA
jgi:hypothetical protein